MAPTHLLDLNRQLLSSEKCPFDICTDITIIFKFWIQSFLDQEQINYINAIEWNGVSHGLDRRSFHGEYLTEWLPLMELDYRSVLIPLNIIGRTGIVGRGLLDEFGPNKCVDVVLLRPRRRRVKRNATDIPVWIPCRDGQGR